MFRWQYKWTSESMVIIFTSCCGPICVKGLQYNWETGDVINHSAFFLYPHSFFSLYPDTLSKQLEAF